MKQLNIFCEGQTEQGFCTQVLQPHLFPSHDGIIHTLAVGNKSNRHIYGIGSGVPYQRLRRFIVNTITQRQGENIFFTTLFDLYGSPDDFPGKKQHILQPSNPTPYVSALETAFAADIDCHRFIPYLQLYEYETMLFADPDAFRISFENCEEEIGQLKAIAAAEVSIEHINDGKSTAPSKRIISVLPEYDGRKSTAGPDIAEFIGVKAIREKCVHFDTWLSQLETIPWEVS